MQLDVMMITDQNVFWFLGFNEV